MDKVVDAVVGAVDFQKRLNDAGITDITIGEIVPPYSDDGKMVLRLTITITSTKTVEEASKELNDAVITALGVDIKLQIATTELLSKSTGKKRAGSGDYLQTTTIQSVPPPGPQPGQQPGPQPGQQPPPDNQGIGAGSTITPLWLCTILLALIFLR
jgi:hypothetical protein